jgi:hypothetical protein
MQCRLSKAGRRLLCIAMMDGARTLDTGGFTPEHWARGAQAWSHPPIQAGIVVWEMSRVVPTLAGEFATIPLPLKTWTTSAYASG